MNIVTHLLLLYQSNVVFIQKLDTSQQIYAIFVKKILMAEPNFSWIYIIIFLAIPLARIIPRILAKKGIGKNFSQPNLKMNFNPGLLKIV